MSADLIRSRLSRTATSGMPTMTKSRAEPDEYMSTSTSITWASMPYTAALRVLNSAIGVKALQIQYTLATRADVELRPGPESLSFSCVSCVSGLLLPEDSVWPGSGLCYDLPTRYRR